MSVKEVRCPSGAILKIHPAPYAQAKALKQAILEEAKGIPFHRALDVAAVMKDVLCYAYSSRKIEAALWECMKRCTYDSGAGDLKITEETFEPVKAREDHDLILFEVAAENIRPFTKSLSVVFERLSSILPNDPT